MTSPATVLPTPTDLERLFALKYGSPATTGPNPRRRHEHGYYLPADVYEATVANAVFSGADWLDVGGGSSPFPDNPNLAAELSAHAGRFVGVDPSANVFDNPYTREKHQAFIEDYTSSTPFDLATLRMVAEHVTNPTAVIDALARLVKPGGRVIVLTVDLWSPITIVSRVVPFGLHYPVKKLLWGGEEKDTFPTAYRMNTRRELKRLFARGGFRESEFAWVDDCSAFAKFSLLNRLEMVTRNALRKASLRYPECNLLGIYQRIESRNNFDNRQMRSNSYF
jgi:SAM-dependent methyltransferase